VEKVVGTYRERSAMARLSLSLSALVCAARYCFMSSFWSAMFVSRIFCLAASIAFSEKMGDTGEATFGALRAGEGIALTA
jgi:hypothetical protein